MLSIAILIPFSKYFFIDQSASLFIVSSIEAICIVLIAYAAKEWRTVMPVRSKVDEDMPFLWAGIIGDEVGRGPGSRKPDGAPDAVFRFKSQGESRIINKITLRRFKPTAEGYKYTREIWRTDLHPSNWVLGVVVDNERIEPNERGELNLHLSENREILLYASDHWMPSNWFERGQKYQVEIFCKGTEDPPTHTLIIP